MKTILSTRYTEIPEGVTVIPKAREIEVVGPRGKLNRSFKHLNLDMQLVDRGQKLRVDLWFATRKQLACIRTVCSHIENMIKGVTLGYKYKMRFCYAHFPINVSLMNLRKITDHNVVVSLANSVVEIRNFLGEKRVRRVPLMDGVEYIRTADVKDQIEISGNDINAVSIVCARISQSCNVRKKDIRKFLDGIYVSNKGHIVEQE